MNSQFIGIDDESNLKSEREIKIDAYKSHQDEKIIDQQRDLLIYELAVKLDINPKPFAKFLRHASSLSTQTWANRTRAYLK